MTNSDRLLLTSLNLAEDRKALLRKNFPEVFCEEKIDFDALQRALGEWIDPGKERFGLNWPGKAASAELIRQSSVGTLLPMRQQSVDFDATENLVIEGDNLEVLKLLQKSYYGKVKMIYIDPPYNTGNEFIYPDNFHEGLEDYLKYSGQVNGEGRKQSSNTETGGRYHSNWLSMMYPRLFLAQNLLREDGVIFISIDDHEVHNLRALMNEVFGEENFVTQFCWKRRTGANDSKMFYVSPDHEYLVCYAKSQEFSFLGVEKNNANYTNPNNDPRGPWARDNLTCNKTAEERPNLSYSITDPISKKIYYANPNRVWAYEINRMQRLIGEGKILFPVSENGTPMYKRHLSELRSGHKPLSSWVLTSTEENTDDEALSMKFPLNMQATKQLRELMDGQVFNFPKSQKMIYEIIVQSSEGNDIILDFFAGSGTTAHAVMELNQEDGGNRKFILVQLPEPTENPTYPTIADITRERVRRVSAKLKSAQPAPDLLNDASTNVKSDLGFKAMRLASSNFKVWDGRSEQMKDIGATLDMFSENILSNRTSEDILYELLLKTGYPLTTPITTLTLAGKKVFSASEGALLICLEYELSLDVIEAMVACDPWLILCLDAGFSGQDQLKANAMQTVRAHNRNLQSSMILKVV